MSTKSTQRIIDKLGELGACEEAISWVARMGFRTAQQAWDRCEEPDWLIWVVENYMEGSDAQLAVRGIVVTVDEWFASFHRCPSDPELCEAIRLAVPRPPRRPVRRSWLDV